MGRATYSFCCRMVVAEPGILPLHLRPCEDHLEVFLANGEDILTLLLWYKLTNPRGYDCKIFSLGSEGSKSLHIGPQNYEAKKLTLVIWLLLHLSTESMFQEENRSNSLGSSIVNDGQSLLVPLSLWDGGSLHAIHKGLETSLGSFSGSVFTTGGNEAMPRWQREWSQCRRHLFLSGFNLDRPYMPLTSPCQETFQNAGESILCCRLVERCKT